MVPTIRTSTIELHLVMRGYKLVALSDPILKSFKGLILELNYFPASEADQMIVMGFPRRGFIPGLSISKSSLGGQSETGEEFQGSIDCGITNFRIHVDDSSVDLGKVLVAR
jgi:hypothetical protein